MRVSAMLAMVFIGLLAVGSTQAEKLKPLSSMRVGMHSDADISALAHAHVKVNSNAETKPQAPTSKAPIKDPNGKIAAPDVPTESKVNVRDVFWMTTVMAAACGVGALPFFFIEKLSKSWAALANAIACGVMIAASFDLLHEAESFGPAPLILGLVVGCLFIKHMQDWLEQYEDVKFQDLRGADAHKIMLFVGIMAAHAIGEGSGVGVSFCGRRGWAHGLLVTLAIGIHNIPEGLAVATVLVARGTTPRKALEWTLLCALPQPLFAVPSFIFVESFKMLLPVSMGFAAGCMLWIVVAELLPDALEDMPAGNVASAVTLSATVLEGMRVMLAGFEQPNGSLAANLSGDLPTILHAAATAGAAAAASCAVATFVASATPPPSATAAVAAWPGVQAAASGGVLLISSASSTGHLLRGSHQSLLVTLVLTTVGAALTWGMHKHQTKLWQDSLRRERTPQLNSHDLEAGTAADTNNSDTSWDVVSTTSAHDLQPGPHMPVSMVGRGDYMKDKPVRTFAARGAVQSLNLNGLAPVAAFMCLLSLVGQAVVHGWKFAFLTAAHPDASFTALWSLSFLWGVPVCTAAAGLIPQLGPAGRYRAAAGALVPGMTMTVTALFSMLNYPTGTSNPKELPFDPNDWISKASAVVVGSSVMSVGWALWPQIQRANPKGARRGLVLGLLCALGFLLLLKFACSATELCVIALL